MKATQFPTAHSPDKYLVSSVRRFLFQKLLSLPLLNLTCIHQYHHTMRFTTTGSTLTNTFIIFTVVLLSLIPVSNASLYSRQDNDATISKISSKYLDAVIFTNPKQGSVYNPGDEVEVKWYVPRPSGKPGLRIDL